MPHDRLVVAGDAWELCRSGEADPSQFGIHGMYGLWFVAGNLVRDFAALSKVEMLPWDDWGTMPTPDVPLSDEQIELFDQMVTVARAADVSVSKLRKLYKDSRLYVPTSVFNAVRGCSEVV